MISFCHIICFGFNYLSHLFSLTFGLFYSLERNSNFTTFCHRSILHAKA
jgi:hypothetical protein